MKAVIMAGGFGKRISDLFSDIPKPMIEICEKPVLQYQIENLKSCGITDIIIVVYHLKDKIINYFGDGHDVGVNIIYCEEQKPLGTAGSLFNITDMLDDDFLLINGDLIFNVDFNKLVEYHKSKNALATLLIHPNTHPSNSEIVIYDENNIVINWIKNDGRGIYRNRVSSGICVLSKEIFSKISVKGKAFIRDDVICPILDTNRVFAYYSGEYIKDMGTSERFRQVTADVKNGIVEARNLNKKQKAVFLDRDGTINKYKGQVTSPRQLELMNGAGEAIKKINESGYLAITISNQPLIATGRLSYSVLDEIHAKLDTLLGEEGAYLDAIYFCPHYYDGKENDDNNELKIKCDCRKPSIGLFKKAAEDFNIDLSESYMVGDSQRDVFAGLAAGCETAYLRCGEQCDIKAKVDEYDDLADFVNQNL